MLWALRFALEIGRRGGWGGFKMWPKVDLVKKTPKTDCPSHWDVSRSCVWKQSAEFVEMCKIVYGSVEHFVCWLKLSQVSSAVQLLSATTSPCVSLCLSAGLLNHSDSLVKTYLLNTTFLWTVWMSFCWSESLDCVNILEHEQMIWFYRRGFVLVILWGVRICTIDPKLVPPPPTPQHTNFLHCIPD